MLQIISGRFFQSELVNKEECDAILYSNFSWIVPLKTIAGELRPVSTYQNNSISSYTFRYTNRYERHSEGSRVLGVGVRADQAVEQFRLLASLYFNSFFHDDRGYVEGLCRTTPAPQTGALHHGSFVPKFFKLNNFGIPDQVPGFDGFLQKVLAMPREKYRLLLTCLTCYFEALEAVGKNFDLAYSMMVYMFESLSKSIDPPKPVWEDYEQNLRYKLDQEMAKIPSDSAKAIRAILLDNPHLSLKKRFVHFIWDHVQDTFFTNEAECVQNALPKSELKKALENLYASRSGFVHELKKVLEQLRYPGFGNRSEWANWDNKPHIAFPGLVRLGRHVLMSFIDRQTQTSKEVYPEWRNELPGIMTLKVAPQFWVGNPGAFTASHLHKYFNGFVESVVNSFPDPSAPRLVVRPLMNRIEELVPNANSDDRKMMAIVYRFFLEMIPEQDREPGKEAFISNYIPEAEACEMEFLVLKVLKGQTWPWPVEECVLTFEKYLGSKHKKKAIRLPNIMDVALMAGIANRFLDAGDGQKYDHWIDQAIFDAAGRKDIQDYLRECRTKNSLICLHQILGRSETVDGTIDPPVQLPGPVDQ